MISTATSSGSISKSAVLPLGIVTDVHLLGDFLKRMSLMAIASPQRGLSGVGFFESSHDYSFALFIDLTMTWITSGERRYVSPVDQRRQEVHDGYLLVVTDSVDGLKWG